MTVVVLYHPMVIYRRYVDQLLSQLKPQLRTLHDAAGSGDIRAAQNAWVAAHMTWLRIGQDDAAYGAFGQLGQQIDGLADGLVGGVRSPSFTGFHRIELELWRRHDADAAAASTRQLQGFIARLTPARVTADLPTTITGLNAWVLRCHEILEDALRDTLSGNDDYGSNTTLATLSADTSATGEMLGVLGPAIAARIPSIVSDGAADLRALDAAISRAGGIHSERPLAALPARTRQRLNAASGTALETLAPVSELMQIQAPGT
jgi:high-affinity iron transporter